MAKIEQFKAYRKRRDFARTSEPIAVKKSQKRGGSTFVIQKHDASHLHYDFRIAINGVLKSWAVPKGPSTNPKVKRLAVPTEDHPLEYAGFEGVIPESQYGAGTVMVWDRGRYSNLRKTDGRPVAMEQALRDGQIEIHLHGKKLKGGYALVRTGGKAKGSRWLLVKMKDKAASAPSNPLRSKPNSVLTNRSLAEIARDAKAKG